MSFISPSPTLLRLVEFSQRFGNSPVGNAPMASSASSAAERRLKLDESILTQQHDVASHARLSSLLQEVTPLALFSRSGPDSVHSL